MSRRMIKKAIKVTLLIDGTSLVKLIARERAVIYRARAFRSRDRFPPNAAADFRFAIVDVADAIVRAS